MLGIIAGFILATLIDMDAIEKASATTTDSASVFARPLLAMIGGFSAAVVYRILSRLADTVESLFRGDMREELNAKRNAQQTQLQAESQQERSRLVYRLMLLQKQIGESDIPKTVQHECDALLRELIDEEPSTPQYQTGD